MQNQINIKAYLSAADKFWIGGQLRSLRQAQGLGVPEAARTTNTTQSQILAIESGSQGPFGSTENYVKGILVYASAFEIATDSPLGAKLTELANIMGGPVAEQSSASGINTLIQSSLSHASAQSPVDRIKGRFLLPSLVGAGLILLAVLTSFDILPLPERIKTVFSSSPKQDEQEPETKQIPASADAGSALQNTVSQPGSTATTSNAKSEKTSVLDEEKTTSPSRTESASTPKSTENNVAKTTSNELMRIKFNGPCWIQTIALDGKVSEKVYQSKDQLEINPAKLKSLVIGNVETITVTNSQGTSLNLKKLANQSSKVARLKEQELNALLQELN